jgi:hypothetical protein
MQGDVCVVVPTIRNHDCVRAYVDNARRHGFDTGRLHVVLVTEAFCDVAAMERMLEEEGVAGRVFDGPRRERWFVETASSGGGPSARATTSQADSMAR